MNALRLFWADFQHWRKTQPVYKTVLLLPDRQQGYTITGNHSLEFVAFNYRGDVPGLNTKYVYDTVKEGVRTLTFSDKPIPKILYINLGRLKMTFHYGNYKTIR